MHLLFVQTSNCKLGFSEMSEPQKWKIFEGASIILKHWETSVLRRLETE